MARLASWNEREAITTTGPKNAALAIALLLAPVTSALPVTAQEQTETLQSFDGGAPAGGSQRTSDWSRVRQLAPGAEMIVTVKSAWTGRRYFVSADDRELVVSNAAGQLAHIARGDVGEIKKERSKVLLYVLAGPLALALAAAGGAIGHAIQGGEGLGGPLLGALALGTGGALAFNALYHRSVVIYRAP